MISKIIDGIEENVSGGSASGGHINAESVGYDNTESELQSTNVQDVIDEVVDIVADKVDKVSSATNGNLAGLDANGNLTDSGVSSSTLEAITNVYGSKNLFPDFVESQTYKGITWTKNADTSITVNGTADGWSTRAYSGSIKLKAGTYILSSGLTWPACYDVYAELAYDDGTSQFINTSLAEEVTFTLANDTTIPTIQVVVRSNKTVSNITIKPMIRDARISNSTYVPYAMTNMELTEKKADKVVPAASGNLATLDSSGNLTDGGMHPLYLIERVCSIPTQGDGTTIIAFSGNAICRVPHYMLLLCGQSGCSSPIIVGFSGGYGYGPIQGVFVSDTLNGLIQTSGTSIIITDGFGGWGDGFMFNLLPQENAEYTVTRG